MCLCNATASPNASLQCVCATQCVLTMRLRLPRRLRLPMRLHPRRLRNACASAPIKPFFDECVFAMRVRLQVVCHTPPGRRNVYIHTQICTLCMCVYNIHIIIYIYIYRHTALNHIGQGRRVSKNCSLDASGQERTAKLWDFLPPRLAPVQWQALPGNR